MDALALAEGYLEGAEAVDDATGNGDQWLLITLGEFEYRPEDHVALPGAKPLSESGKRSLLISIGERIMTRLEIELYDVLCGVSKEAISDRKALGLTGDTALAAMVAVLTNGLSVAPQVAAIAAAFLMRRLGQPVWEEVCDVWNTKGLKADSHALDERGFDVKPYLDRRDETGHPDPEVEGFGSPAKPQSKQFDAISWPDERDAPDYAYVSDLVCPDEVTLTYDTVRSLFELNAFPFDEESPLIAIALRGAQLKLGHEAEDAGNIEIETGFPDHRNMRCLVGFAHPPTKALTLYTGSTVPCRAAVWGYANGGSKSNMLPTGLYRYYVWRHSNIFPALRLGAGNGTEAQLEAGARECVLRNTNNDQIERSDLFDLSTPYDNVHCSYYLDEQSHLGASFSSWGCLTVRGSRKPSAQWAKFQNHIEAIGAAASVDLCLLTGKDAALASVGKVDRRLSVLRRGAQGVDVKDVQGRLGVPRTGRFDAPTVDRFTAFQRDVYAKAGRGRIADGIVSPEFRRLAGWVGESS